MTINYIADENGTMATKTMRATMGLMGAANMIGTKWCSANYPLLTNVSRGEWGYQGMFSTDMFLQCSPNIDTNDLNTKVNNARKFISKGNKVKVTLRFRGREMAHVQQSRHILDDFAELLSDIASVEKAPKLEGRNMSMVLTEKR